MNSNPLVSIVIPVYNRESLVSETLDSIQAQTYTQWECILVDDGSTDNTMHILRSYAKTDPRFKIYQRPDNYLPGSGGARNYGFSLAKGEYFQWFDSDDIMLPKHLELKVNAFLTDSTLDIVFCDCAHFKDNTSNIVDYWKVETENIFEDHLTDKISIQTSLGMFKKSFLDKHNMYFIEDILIQDDWEYYCRILIEEPNYTSLHKSLILYRLHDVQKIRTYTKKMGYSFFKANKKVYALAKSKNKINANVRIFFAKNLIKHTKKFRRRGYFFLPFKIFSFLNRVVVPHFRFSFHNWLKLHLSFYLFMLFKAGYSFGTRYYMRIENLKS